MMRAQRIISVLAHLRAFYLSEKVSFSNALTYFLRASKGKSFG